VSRRRRFVFLGRYGDKYRFAAAGSALNGGWLHEIDVARFWGRPL
jgi:hypothetical protein